MFVSYANAIATAEVSERLVVLIMIVNAACPLKKHLDKLLLDIAMLRSGTELGEHDVQSVVLGIL